MVLRRSGEYLYGEEWQTPLSEVLDVNERTMRRWVSGDTKVPVGVWKELFIMLDVARDEANFLIEQTKKLIDEGAK
jgi:hypothetical protein